MQLLSRSPRGFVGQAAPSIRLSALLLLVVAVSITDSVTLPGTLFCGGLLLLWLPLCAFEWKRLGVLLLMGLALLLFLSATLGLAAWLGEGQFRPALAWGLAWKGFALAGLTWATLHTFRLGALLTTLSRVPGIPALILGQVAQQIGNLLDETRRISQAWALRSGPGRRPFALLAAAPVVWLPRVAHRAEGVAAAMELRGIPSHALYLEEESFGVREGILLAISTMGLVASAWIRWTLS